MTEKDKAVFDLEPAKTATGNHNECLQTIIILYKRQNINNSIKFCRFRLDKPIKMYYLCNGFNESPVDLDLDRLFTHPFSTYLRL